MAVVCVACVVWVISDVSQLTHAHPWSIMSCKYFPLPIPFTLLKSPTEENGLPSMILGAIFSPTCTISSNCDNVAELIFICSAKTKLGIIKKIKPNTIMSVKTNTPIIIDQNLSVVFGIKLMGLC